MFFNKKEINQFKLMNVEVLRKEILYFYYYFYFRKLLHKLIIKSFLKNIEMGKEGMKRMFF